MTVSGQSWEEELGFIYTKGKYLMETERYDDAVRQFTEVVNKNPEYEDVLLLRARCKYHLAAYLGVKKDLNQYIGYKGISPDVVVLMAKVEHSMGNNEAARNSLSTATTLFPSDIRLMEMKADVLYQLNEDDLACEAWTSAANLGSKKAKRNLKNYCDIDYDVVFFNKPKKERPESKYEDKVEKKNDEYKKEEKRESGMGGLSEAENTGNDMERTDEGSQYDEENDDDEEFISDVPNMIEIDEDLTIVISGSGLGERRILNQPNILILSEESGKVAIDVCVNRSGRILTVDFNSTESSISRESLVSLSLRKAKEFWFEKSKLKEQCGTILFDIRSN